MEIVSGMQAFAGSGEWEQVGALAERLESAIMQVPEARRRDVILQVRRGFETVHSLALSSRDEVADRLARIRRGSEAKRAYTGKD